MLNRIKSFVQRHRDILSYIFFGGLTTVVNYLVYLPCYNWLNLSAAISNIIAWTAAVAFAFLTNKPFVFQSHSWSREVVLPELGRFVSCRIGSGLLETGIMFLCDLVSGNGNLWKLGTSILVVILNYIASKLLVFRKRG